MKQTYTTPKFAVAKTQIRASLLAGSNSRQNIPFTGNKETNSFDARIRQNGLD